MGLRSDRKKQQKKAARKKKARQQRHENRLEKAKEKFRLDVLHGGGWKPWAWFASMKEVDEHVRITEEIRQKGDTEIIPGRVIEMATRKIVATIEGFNPDDAVAITLKDAAKDEFKKEDEGKP